jgi:hypothetical protein
VASKFVIHLGTDTRQNFGGGTVTIKSKRNDQLDWTSDSTTSTATDIIKQDAGFIGARFKLTLSGATSPNIDYSITYE